MNRILIAGVCQNVDKYLPRVIENIYKITSHFSEYKIIIVENDSTDNTKQILNNWAWEDDNVILKTLDNIHNYVPNKKYRTQYLAFCRNTYVEEISNLFEYSVVLDMDDVMAKENFQEQGVIDSLQILRNNPKIGALTANSTPKYYDIWALRNSECNYDCWKKVFWSMQYEGLSYENATEKYVTVHTKDYSQSTDLIPVQSAFNGLAVYRNEALIHCRYTGIIDGLTVAPTQLEPTGAEICEHVPLNYMMRQLGYKIYINPKMYI
jgi:glycosyltransferase involved in cell wall biosynthesis